MKNCPPFQATTINPAVHFHMFETHIVFETFGCFDTVAEYATRREAEIAAALMNLEAAHDAWLSRELYKGFDDIDTN